MLVKLQKIKEIKSIFYSITGSFDKVSIDKMAEKINCSCTLLGEILLIEQTQISNYTLDKILSGLKAYV